MKEKVNMERERWMELVKDGVEYWTNSIGHRKSTWKKLEREREELKERKLQVSHNLLGSGLNFNDRGDVITIV